jgi:hypothetical protein
MFQPLLRSGLSVPFEITRNCPSCKDSAATKVAYPHGSIVVDLTCRTALRFQCINHFCAGAYISLHPLSGTFREPPASYQNLNCFLTHRDYSLASMNLLVDGEMPVKPETVVIGKRQVERMMPDFKEIDPVVTTGPYKHCAGYLTWSDDRRITHDTWLKCTECAVRYHAIIFASRGLELAGDYTTVYDKYRFEINEMTGEPIRLVRIWTEGARNIRGVSREIAIHIDKCLFEGREITEAEATH